MPAKISYLVHQFLPRYFTGTEQYVFAVARAMQRRGHEVEVIALEPDFSEQDRLQAWDHEVVDGLPVERIRVWYHLDRDYERMEYRHPFVAERFRAHLERRRPDIVHAFHLRYLGADLLAEAAALGIPTVVHLMDFWFLCPAVVLRRPDGALCGGPPEGGLGCIDCLRPDLGRQIDEFGLREPIRRIAAHSPPGSTPGRALPARAATLTERPARLRERLLRADRILAPSAFLRQVFVDNGYPAERIEVLGYGVDPERLGGAPRTAAGGVLRCAFVGSIAEHKGTDLAVDAVLGSTAALELTIHGRTSDFPDYAGPLVERARSDPRIRFAGPFPRDRLGAVLAATDVLLVPSRWYENTPFVVLEAFAAGVPVLAADLGGMRELVVDRVHGELFRPGDAADLRLRLERLARDPERLARYRAALPRVKTQAENADEIEAIYRALGAPTGD
jgi:glycosyltransferase involved in cell wall biosynthesis